ncbi:hypothetical protein B9G69_012780 [Bdellovibrio sp. SKB1291214]|uniref:hypothetical protein n=1 Tax=Bdellovibrio sp. SKB1291214 TaxID=1732569 RepID=UPI000B519A2A|nr:hypothetical protein [Bdellovibrio sp. SKB1291214]UYL07922.1 hypothetical protein B9G69_012780 [Bdellovibrio sp. SKB1291214]
MQKHSSIIDWDVWLLFLSRNGKILVEVVLEDGNYSVFEIEQSQLPSPAHKEDLLRLILMTYKKTIKTYSSTKTSPVLVLQEKKLQDIGY